MAKVYLSGPYQGCDKQQAMDWREKVKTLLGEDKVCIPYWEESYSGLTHNECCELVDRDLNSIEECTAVIYNAWKPSWGSGCELRVASDLEKDVVIFGEGTLSPWIRAHSSYIAQTLEDACEWLAGRYGWKLNKVVKTEKNVFEDLIAIKTTWDKHYKDSLSKY